MPLSEPVVPRRHAVAAATRDRVLSALERNGALQRLGARDAAVFRTRLQRHFADAFAPLRALYGHESGEQPHFQALLERLFGIVSEAAEARTEDLRILDHRREVDPDWFLHETMIGYVCYADLFAGDLAGVGERLDHLAELGVTYLHLMPLLAARDGPNDGGYAVVDYTRVDPRLGDVDDLRALSAALRERGMSLCIDVVLNHTAREHRWAQAARAGDPHYLAFYLTFMDRTLPDAYETTLPEVFPDLAPGSFSWDDDLRAWVWTSFYDFQWDLDYRNPEVFAAMLEVLLFLANTGVEVLRLDAVPFLWKRLGTDCQNQPEVHLLLQALRALVRIAAPATVFKAEAIVAPGKLVRYLGGHDDGQRPECELAYHNQLMVLLWSALAARDATLMTAALGRMEQPPRTTGWVTYVRGHDDIGWAVTDADAAAVGLDGATHRAFLASFYAGDFPGSFAQGERFGVNAATGDARSSGTAASLAGIEAALEAGEPELLDAAVARLLLLHAVIYGWGGVPLLYMGDELGLRNDRSYLRDPTRAGDNRWLHRPRMDWKAAARRHDAGTVEGRLFAGLRRLADARRRCPPLRGGGATTPWWTDSPQVFAWLRQHPREGGMLGLANFSDTASTIDAGLVAHAGMAAGVDLLRDGAEPVLRDGRLELPAWGCAWIVPAEASRWSW